MTDALTLRDRQAELARNALLSGAVEVMISGDPDAVSLADLARGAGVSERTLYRYFATREELMAAATERAIETFELAPPIDPDDLVGSFDSAAKRMAEQPILVRNLLKTRAGGHARARHRRQRSSEIVKAVRASAPDAAPPRATDAAGAVIAALCSVTSWSTVRDESGLSAEQAQVAVAWAISTLVAAIRAGQLPDIAGSKEKSHARGN